LGAPKAEVKAVVAAVVAGEVLQALKPPALSCLSVEVGEAAVKGLKAQAVALAVAPGSMAVVRPGSRGKRSWADHLEEAAAAGRSQVVAKPDL
jgi:hypothetical protein